MTLEGLVSFKYSHYEAISNLRRPLRDHVQRLFPQATPTELQELFVNKLLDSFRPHLENILPTLKDESNRNIAKVDIVRTTEGLFRCHFTNLSNRIFNDGQLKLHGLFNMGLSLLFSRLLKLGFIHFFFNF